ncbi:hypothetical protein HYALB_00013939 [Hymenoscyphus albidus]|uniref:Uncharacterized protein n=1 Tax=Hymenoscyphus albidus TaxID=595503 RepID=A0A9N9Q0K7_9HELO|nr:hypothetical protein HYALB_00013939 [Hymenoscyphus albidus]
MASKENSNLHREVSPVRPLQLRKQPSQRDDPCERHIAYQARTGARFSQPHQKDREDLENMAEYTPALANNAYSALGDCVQTYFSGIVAKDSPKPEGSASTYSVSSDKARDRSDSSSAIMGDFVPVESQAWTLSLRPKKVIAPPEPSNQVAVHINPYEFDPASPLIRESRQTRITDFIQRPGSSPASYSTPRMGHFKNSHSQEEKKTTRPRPSPLNAEDITGYELQRCPSTPELSSMDWAVEQPSPALQRKAAEYRALVTPIESSPVRSTYGEYGTVWPPALEQLHRGEPVAGPSAARSSNRKVEGKRRTASPQRNDRSHGECKSTSPVRRNTNEDTVHRDRQQSNGRASPRHFHQNHYNSQSTPTRGRRDILYESQATTLQGYTRAYLPTGTKAHSQVQQVSPISSPYDRHQTSSPNKSPETVYERDEANGRYARKETDSLIRSPSPDRSPKKRSRSPMKKLFGEKGFFGVTPEEATNVKQSPKKLSSNRSVSRSSDSRKKPGMMDKLKSKLGEIAEKADMTPKRVPRNIHDKNYHPSISLPPAEQARILMELELMIVHTANKFLMIQFGQGRLTVDSIKKTVDGWEAKGRPKVIEFMYDQATQRSLVTANLQEIRFYGERACNQLSISAMLYAWKGVATKMAIRTFCDADTVLKKLIFDIEQILELLGAVDSIMIRIQQLREKINLLIRVARESTNSGATSQGFTSSEGRSHPSYDSRRSGEKSLDDPYGGLKLVPDHYRED